ncbi:MAG: formate dehydrogenase accessory sulfurtransferase FdhD [Burkholderiaceae bacterium]
MTDAQPIPTEAAPPLVDDSACASTGVRGVPALAVRAGVATRTIEHLAEEVPVALEFNGLSHAVMLATPTDLEDFALGFALTEGLIDHPGDLLDLEPETRADGIVLHLRVTARCEARLKDRRRSLAGRTGCGLCGTDRLDQVLHLPARPLPATRVRAAALQRAVHALASGQPLKEATGATHAAAWCDARGEPQLVREDVGRHNALDKLVGALQRTRIDAGAGLVAVTSRASLEMVQKTAAAGIAVLAARSAPTHLAVQIAQRVGLLLAGYVREGRATVYAGAERLDG